MAKYLVIHGPNLNLLGIREPHIYGGQSLVDINEALISRASPHELMIIQSQREYELIEAIHQAINEEVVGILINPAAFTHTSIALRDALLAVKIPFVEIHLSNIYAREAFRQKSYFSDIALGTISGLGPNGYLYGLDYLIETIES